MGSLDRYILKTAFVPMAMSLLVAALLLLLEQMLRLLDFVLNENGPVDVVWRMLAFLLPQYLSLALPLSLFLGAVLAYRKLSLSSEMDTMQATGMSHWRLLRPVYGLGVVMMLINFAILAYIQPYAQYGYQELRYELQAGLLGARVPAGKFVSVSKNVKLRIGTTADGGAELGDLFVAYRDKQGNRSTFTAEKGKFMRGPDPDSMVLRLEHGRQMVVRAGVDHPGVLNFELQDIVIPLPKATAFRARGAEKHEATFGELISILKNAQDKTSHSYREYRANFHYRLIHTLTFLALPFLAVAFGVTNRRQPSGAGPALGIFVIVLYHKLLEIWAVGAVSSGELSPWASMYPLFGVFSVFALALFYGVAEKPGFNAVAYAEIVWAGTIGRVTKLFRRKPEGQSA
ncbi:LptF/LptG family permease [Kordiimonas marina]|uniref:LptF/LptG family permease n=1 Tax=Kordiimonas marina TaxID=2872312 RepID=UPI001FF3126F|nr:LptF/LptG family permease [Kordiimonas marina]MCJ9430576.1 LptF/LptG family permease [Kordiimonas marina]